MHQMEQAFIPYDSRNKVLLSQNDPAVTTCHLKRAVP
jgi:hypothetical protein